VVIDVIDGNTEAAIKESADLVYNLVVLWVAAGIAPAQVWAEMERREKLFGIAEKLPKNMAEPATRPQSGGARNPPPAQAPLISSPLEER
jgi:phosphoribosyl-ATP pyrophosphohydrolase